MSLVSDNQECRKQLGWIAAFVEKITKDFSGVVI